MSTTIPPELARARQARRSSETPARSDATNLALPHVPAGRAGHTLTVEPAGPGDHPSIHHFLTSIFQAPSAAEFHAQSEEPFYEPANRLVIKSDHQIVAHVRLANYEMSFGPLVLPITAVSELATLPENRGRGCAAALLQAAENRMLEEGATLGVVRTSVPQLYAKQGWTVCGRHCYSTAKPRDILAYLSATNADSASSESGRVYDPEGLLHSPRPLNIRLWRHVEEAALIRLYSENARGSYGSLRRSDAYWRWLVSRRGYDRIYVAIEGPDKFELDESHVSIVGYAAMNEGRIVELMADDQHSKAAAQLLARACGDAIERDYHSVRFDAPPGNPLHQTIALAGGEHRCHEAESGEVFMVKLFDPLSFLQSICGQLHARAKAADLPRPCELGLLYGEDKYQIVISRRSVKLAPGKLGRSYLTCNATQLTQLMLGHLHVESASAAGKLEFSTRVAEEIASVLFPRLPFWRPSLDDLPATD